ncbi:MAG: hypothetical protein V4736_02910, partial [Bdellovibrionota bacterium]
MKFIFGLLYCGFIFASAVAEAEIRTARIFDIGKTDGVSRFTQSTEVTVTGADKLWLSSIKDSTGTVVMTEKAIIKDGKIIYQYIEQLQINESYELKTEGNKASFETFEIVDGKKGKSKGSGTVSIEKGMITGPMTESFLHQHWDRLMSGETVKAEFGVFEFSKTVTFQFKKMKADEKSILMQMKPAGFIVSMLVDPMTIEFDAKSKAMVRFV